MLCCNGIATMKESIFLKSMSIEIDIIFIVEYIVEVTLFLLIYGCIDIVVIKGKLSPKFIHLIIDL